MSSFTGANRSFSKTTAQVAEYFKTNFVELGLGSIMATTVQTATIDLPGDISLDTTLSSLPSPLASADALQDTSSATPLIDESQLGGPPADTPSQDKVGADAAPALDPNELWESMAPGSRAQSPKAAAPSGRVSPLSDPPVAASVPKLAPAMASLTPVEVGL